jgi:peroxin-19
VSAERRNNAEKSEHLNDAFAAELAAGMEEMLKTLNESANPLVPTTSERLNDNHQLSEEEKQFRKLWEQMLVDGMNGKEDSEAGQRLDAMLRDAFKVPEAKQSPTTNPSGSKSAVPIDDSFQRAIHQAMDKIKSSDETLNVSRTDHFRFNLTVKFP